MAAIFKFKMAAMTMSKKWNPAFLDSANPKHSENAIKPI
jgi:hypothetical protein